MREATSGESAVETASRPLLAPERAPSPVSATRSERRSADTVALVEAGARGPQAGGSKTSASRAAVASPSATPTRTPCSGWFERWARSVRAGVGERVGCVFGVYLPCIQNSCGVVLFLRIGWLLGAAGLLQSLAMLVLCTCCVCNCVT